MMVKTVNALGGKAESVYFENLDHNDGIEYAYRETDLLKWLLLQKKSNRTTVKEFLSEMF